jgi:uncharacterized protein (DUF2336 family)
MGGYQAFAELSLSNDSDERGHAAHLAALAYLNHDGAADEHAALYAALVGFLDDTSVKVRAALAYGLLHSAEAPRPVMLALVQDSGVIARAVLQYSPVLVDADLFPMVRGGDEATLLAVAQRQVLSARLCEALIGRGNRGLTLRLLRRQEVSIGAAVLADLGSRFGEDAEMRGALLARTDLPAATRLGLVRQVTETLRNCRLVKGALTADRLSRVLRDGTDAALTTIGETAPDASRGEFVEALVGTSQLNTRLLLHALATGHVMFFAACIAGLSASNSSKVFTLLESGGRPALMALFGRCGLEPALGNLLVRMIQHARTADLADDVAARHYVVTALTEELLEEHAGDIPEALEEAFAYLNEQNIMLARKAARGVMAAFAVAKPAKALPVAETSAQVRLPAA